MRRVPFLSLVVFSLCVASFSVNLTSSSHRDANDNNNIEILASSPSENGNEDVNAKDNNDNNNNDNNSNVEFHNEAEFDQNAIFKDIKDNNNKNHNETEAPGLRDIVQKAGGARAFALLMLSLALFMGWIMYAAFYNSRVVGKGTHGLGRLVFVCV